jgi:hypothetical protein
MPLQVRRKPEYKKADQRHQIQCINERYNDSWPTDQIRVGINLKAAKALGLKVSEKLPAVAEKVIE